MAQIFIQVIENNTHLRKIALKCWSMQGCQINTIIVLLLPKECLQKKKIKFTLFTSNLEEKTTVEKSKRIHFSCQDYLHCGVY